MNRITSVFAFAALACSWGCGTTLTEAGRNVQLMKADPSAGCKEVGQVSGIVKSPQPPFIEDAKNEMRNEAATKGANYVRMETLTDSSMTGTAYACPAGATPAPGAK